MFTTCHLEKVQLDFTELWYWDIKYKPKGYSYTYRSTGSFPQKAHPKWRLNNQMKWYLVSRTFVICTTSHDDCFLSIKSNWYHTILNKVKPKSIVFTDIQQMQHPSHLRYSYSIAEIIMFMCCRDSYISCWDCQSP